MTKERAELMKLILEAVYHRLDDIGVKTVPTGPIVEYPSSWGVQVNKSDEVTTYFTVEAVLHEIEEMTD